MTCCTKKVSTLNCYGQWICVKKIILLQLKMKKTVFLWILPLKRYSEKIFYSFSVIYNIQKVSVMWHPMEMDQIWLWQIYCNPGIWIMIWAIPLTTLISHSHRQWTYFWNFIQIGLKSQNKKRKKKIPCFPRQTRVFWALHLVR